VGADAGLIHKDNLHELFREPGLASVQFLNYRELRRAAYTFVNAILAQVPVSEEQQQALRLVRDAIFLGRVAIEKDEQARQHEWSSEWKPRANQ